MWNTIKVAAVALVLLPSLGYAEEMPQAKDPAEQGERTELKPEPFSRFQGTLALAQKPARVAVRTWIIHNKEKLEKFPESGLLLVELRAGVRCTTIVDGKRVDRHEGDFWIVPAGTSWGVETGRYSVVLQTIALSAEGGDNIK